MPNNKFTIGYRRILFLIGCFIVTFPQGFHLYWGNLAAYVYSYYLFENNLEFLHMGPWPITVFFAARNIGVVTWELLHTFVFKEWLPLFGIIVGNAGLFLSYFTVNGSIALFIALICCAFGYGTGSFQMWILKSLADCAKKEELGVFTAIPVASTYIGAIMMNAVVTLYINPLNLSPTVNIDGLIYFPQKELLDKVPSVFLVIGAITMGMQVLGSCLVKTFSDEINNGNKSQDQLSAGEVISYSSMNNITSDATDPKSEYGSSRQDRESELSSSIKFNLDPESKQVPLASSKSENVVPGNNHIILNLKEDKSRQYVPIEVQRKLDTTFTDSHCDSKEMPSPESASNSTNEEISQPKRKDYTTKEALKSPILYVLGSSRMLLILPTFLVLNYYKLFGELWISDDHFITNISYIMSLMNCFSRFIWGIAFDRVGWKKTYLFSVFLGVLLILWYYFTAMTNKWLYLIVNILLPTVLLGTVTSIFPLINLVFGKTNAVTIFGIMRIPSIFEALLVTVIIEIELVHLGWFYTFIIAGLGVMISFFLYWVFLPEI